MKTSILLVTAVLCSTLSIAQKLDEKNVPTSVKSTFNSKFPNAEKVAWEKENEDYEASFVSNKIEQSALLDNLGNLIETEVEIEKKELPEKVNPYLKSHYSSKKIKETSKITSAKGITTFEVEIKGMDLIFDANGNFLKEVSQ